VNSATLDVPLRRIDLLTYDIFDKSIRPLSELFQKTTYLL